MLENLLSIAIFILDIIAVYDIIKGTKETGMKILWILIVLLLPILGVLLYYSVGKETPIVNRQQ